MRALADYVELVIVPTQPLKLVDFDGLRCRAPRIFARPVRRRCGCTAKLLFAPGSLRTRLTNALAFPRGLALANDVRQRKIERIHAIGLAVPATVAYVASQLTGVPYSIGIHDHAIPADGLTSEKLSSASFTRTVSSRTCRDLQALVPAAASHCLVVRSGVHVPERAPDPPRRRVPRLLVVGSDPSDLLNALSQLRDCGYTFSCDLVSDALPPRLQRLLQAYNLRRRVMLMGPITFDEVGQALERGDYDLFVLASGGPSDVREDAPLLAIQAMARGVATVAAQGASLDEVIDAGSGFLVAPRDVHGLFTVLERLLLDSGLRNRTGERARGPRAPRV